jgi:hypothetical protein
MGNMPGLFLPVQPSLFDVLASDLVLSPLGLGNPNPQIKTRAQDNHMSRQVHRNHEDNEYPPYFYFAHTYTGPYCITSPNLMTFLKKGTKKRQKALFLSKKVYCFLGKMKKATEGILAIFFGNTVKRRFSTHKNSAK